MPNVQMNQKQTQRFAQAIFADVEKYISENKEDYEEFLVENVFDNSEKDSLR